MNKRLLFLQLGLLMLARTGFAMAPDEAPQNSTSGGITEVSVERTWCNGSCPIDTLVLHADGKAKYTGKENTQRTGQFTGAYWDGDFDLLARWLVAEGFFELGDSYGFPNGDNPTEIIRVTRGGEGKSVINYARNKSLKLWGTGNLIRAIAANIHWQPLSSGIRGQATRKSVGDDWRPYAEDIYVEPQGGAPSGMNGRFTVRSDREGKFEIPLQAGTYRISSLMTEMTRGKPQTVVVESNRFTEVSVRSEALTSNAPENNASLPAVDPPPPPSDGHPL